MKRKLGIMCECIEEMESIDVLDLIRDAGFDCYFTNLTDLEKVSALVEKGNRLGLTCDFIHGPFRGINNMWLAGMEYLDIMGKMKQAIDVAEAVGVPTVIIHASSTWEAPEITELGLARFDELVLYATERKVTIAFENLRMIGNLAYFADRYRKMEYVRFCYDCGHEHCYTKTIRWMDVFGKRAVATHIHDNLGRGEEREGSPDLHMLPFDGTINYEAMMRKLDEYQYQGSLMLEVSNRRHPDVDPRAFLTDCYERLCKISQL